ncbi:MAG: SPOR domain-containing protein [Bacteroidales bacterium]|nr:SPOR domain-containing protein [Bacteroidales bacterium]
MNFSKYIRELVIRNECIIVPGFGGFETHYKPASFDKTTGKLNPPTKKIVFKPEYKADGGVLYNYVAEKEKCSLSEAKTRVDEWIAEITSQINVNGYFLFEGFGRLVRNVSGALQFDALEKENYLIDSFGLSDITVNQIEQEESVTLPVSGHEEIEKPHSAKKNLWIIPVVSLLVLALLFFILKLGINEKIDSLFDGSVFGKHRREQKIVFGHRPSPAFKDSSTVKLNDKLDERTEKQQALFYKEPEKKPDIPEIKAETVISGQNNTFGEEKRYIIVAGSFMKESLAIELQRKLLDRGYHPEIIKTDNGMYRVSLESHEDIDMAIRRLEKYKKEIDNMVWILRI